MNCDKVQDILLTDYLDDQMNEVEKKKVDDHLSSCLSCREFFALVQKTTREPFDHAQPIDPPETIWQNIQEKISHDQESKVIADWWDKILNLSFVRQPAYALALSFIFIMFVFYFSFIKNPSIQIVENVPATSIELTEEEIYIVEQLDSISDDETIEDVYALAYEKTDLEEYFL